MNLQKLCYIFLIFIIARSKFLGRDDEGTTQEKNRLDFEIYCTRTAAKCSSNARNTNITCGGTYNEIEIQDQRIPNTFQENLRDHRLRLHTFRPYTWSTPMLLQHSSCKNKIKVLQNCKKQDICFADICNKNCTRRTVMSLARCEKIEIPEVGEYLPAAQA